MCYSTCIRNIHTVYIYTLCTYTHCVHIHTVYIYTLCTYTHCVLYTLCTYTHCVLYTLCTYTHCVHIHTVYYTHCVHIHTVYICTHSCTCTLIPSCSSSLPIYCCWRGGGLCAEFDMATFTSAAESGGHITWSSADLSRLWHQWGCTVPGSPSISRV